MSVVFVFYVSELGGCCPTLLKIFGVRVLVCDGIPTLSNIRDLAWVDAGTITYKFLLILVSTTIYIFVQPIFTWKLNLVIYVHVQELIASKHCVSKLFTKESS